MINLMYGDCLERMKEIQDGSVDLILCDPPYGTVGGMGAGERRYSSLASIEWDVAISPASIFEHCERLLRVNGALILFSQEPYTSRLITEAHGNLPFSYRLTWLKDHFANCLLVNKAPVSYSEDVLVFFKSHDTLKQHPLRKYAKLIMEHIGRSLKQINSDLGHRRAEHFFYVDSTQFGLCTEQTYEQLISRYHMQNCPFLMSYGQMSEIDRRFVRRFNLPEGQKYKSNILEYKKIRNGLHPMEKPVALLEDLIKTYSNPGDTVLDFTMGSGSTGVACLNSGRPFIGIEKDQGYFETAKHRIEGATS